MASVGPLLLLMMLSSILTSTGTVSLGKLNKKNINTFGRAVKRNKAVIIPCIEAIPEVGPFAAAIFNLAVEGLNSNPNADLITEFEKLNLKLDEYHIEQKCSSWKSGPYSKPKRKIESGWDAYKVFLGSLQQAKDNNERQKHKDAFTEAYSKYEPATSDLSKLLKDKGNTWSCNLGDVLAEHVKCHEKDIIEYTEFINKLIFKGNVMNLIYYKLKEIESEARFDALAKITHDIASAMFEIHKQCIIRSMEYVEKDVKPLIYKTRTRDQLAKEVWSFLTETYDRYDWMVVAFITKNSKFKHLKFLNKHVLSGFTSVSTELVTVAVARQVKGTHTKVKEVSKAIETCIPEKVLCYKVAETLSKCGEKVAGIPVSQTYTAVHAYTRKAHQSLDAKEANPKAEDEDEDEVSAAPENSSAETPYIYTGKCEKFKFSHLPVVKNIVKAGKFVVLIKSDEEMMEKGPCSKLNCGQRGRCVPMKDIFLAVCQCTYPYYGQHCENDINDYGTELEKEAGKHAESYNRKSQNNNKVKVKTD